MTEMSHLQAQQALSARADGLLGAEEILRLEEHLSGCPTCRSESAQLLDLEISLRMACQEHGRAVRAVMIEPEEVLAKGKILRQADRDRRTMWAAALLVIFLLVWLAGVGLQQAWPPDTLLRMDKTRPAVLPTLAVYEPSPTPTEEPRVGGWHWQPAFAENRAVETPRPKRP